MPIRWLGVAPLTRCKGFWLRSGSGAGLPWTRHADCEKDRTPPQGNPALRARPLARPL